MLLLLLLPFLLLLLQLLTLLCLMNLLLWLWLFWLLIQLLILLPRLRLILLFPLLLLLLRVLLACILPMLLLKLTKTMLLPMLLVSFPAVDVAIATVGLISTVTTVIVLLPEAVAGAIRARAFAGGRPLLLDPATHPPGRLAVGSVGPEIALPMRTGFLLPRDVGDDF